MPSLPLPTYLTMKLTPKGGAARSMSDVALRFGEVVDAYPPNDPRNKLRPPSQWEYIVRVNYRDGTSSEQPMEYRCTMAEGFGSMADHLRYNVRKTDAKPEVGGDVPTRGAQVLILCPNGDRADALIVGARRAPEVKKADPSETFLDFEFNGVHASVDQYGALVLQVPGATNLDGTPSQARDSSNKGSQVEFAKSGIITVTDQNGQKVVIDPVNKKVEVFGSKVTVFSDNVQLGGDNLTEQNHGVVVADGIDLFTGLTYYELENTSKKVKAKR